MHKIEGAVYSKTRPDHGRGRIALFIRVLAVCEVRAKELVDIA